MSGHLDAPPPGPPDPPYIEGDLGAPSAEEFSRRRDLARSPTAVQCSRCGQYATPTPDLTAEASVTAAWVEAECEIERGRDMLERASSLISEVMVLAKCSQTREWLEYTKAWEHDYENGAGPV